MSFATADDVAVRAGRSFTDAETTLAEMLCDAATAVIADAVGRDDAWADDLDPVPQMLRFMCIELANRVMGNPESLSRFQEQLGAHSYAKAFAASAAGGGLMLTEVETMLVRRTVYGRTSGSVRVESLADEVADLIYGDCS